MNEPLPSTPQLKVPAILLVEDDPVSAAYLREAVALLPARVDLAGSIAEAMQLAFGHRHDLYLVDAHLPDGRGESLLQALRDRGFDAPALAHTAARDPNLLQQLLTAGFTDVLCKPLGVADLHEALRRGLQMVPATTGRSSGSLPLWDDSAALAVLGGQPSSVHALRGLFLGELPGQRQRIGAACQNGDAGTVRDELHRLVASCGFVGAARLAQAVRAMQAAPLDAPALQAVQFAIDDVLGSA